MTESILSTLRQEHQHAAGLIRQIEGTKDVAQKKDLYLQLKEELILHMEGEEKTLYAHLLEDVLDEEAEEVALNAEDEHQGLKNLLAKIDNISIESEEWDRTFKKLHQAVDTHVADEESALFAEAKQDFTKEELIEFDEEFTEAKRQTELY